MNKKIAIIILISFIVFSSIITNLIHRATTNQLTPNQEIKEETLIDDEAPNLVLKESDIVIYQNDVLNYESMIIEATDNVDGDLTSFVEHNEIDTTNIGEYEIEYKVKDSSENETKQILKVLVKEALPIAGD